MAVADRHDFAAFAAASRGRQQSPFFAERKVASMKDLAQIQLPLGRVSLRPVSGAVG